MLSTTSSVVLPGGKSPKPNKKSMFLTVPGGHKRVASLPISNSLNAAAGGYESDSTRLLLEDNGGSTFGHDLIPYTGVIFHSIIFFNRIYFCFSVSLTRNSLFSTSRTFHLLTARFDSHRSYKSPLFKEYCRSSRLVLAITIVPAVNVSDWHVMKGEGPMTRYVVVDVTNHTNMDAELAYGDGKSLCVQSKEACRFIAIFEFWRLNSILLEFLCCVHAALISRPAISRSQPRRLPT